jgi:hypothetical protein
MIVDATGLRDRQGPLDEFSNWVPEMAALLHVVHGPYGGMRLMLMMEAYVDESADETKQKVYAMAALIAPAGVWNCLWGEWDRALAANNLPEFHMKDCVATNPETGCGYGVFADRDEAERERLQREFIGIMTGFGPENLGGMASGVLLEPYNRRMAQFKRLRTVPPKTPLSGSLSDPYYLVFQHLVELATGSQFFRETGETLGFVFDRHHLQGSAGYMYEGMRGSKNVQNRDRMGTCAFADRVRVKPLQAADVLAYETYRYVQDTILEGKRQRWQYTELERMVSQGHYFDEKAIERLAQSMEQQAQTKPWIPASGAPMPARPLKKPPGPRTRFQYWLGTPKRLWRSLRRWFRN